MLSVAIFSCIVLHVAVECLGFFGVGGIIQGEHVYRVCRDEWDYQVHILVMLQVCS